MRKPLLFKSRSARRSRPGPRPGPRLRYLHYCLWPAVVLSLGLGAWGGVRYVHSLYPILEVEVQGEFQHLRPERLRRVVEQRLRGGLLAVDLEAIQEALLAETWVDAVTVRRLWPDRLQLFLREQRPVARWGREGLLNERGEFFPGQITPATARLPLLYGSADAARRVLRYYYALRQKFAGVGLQLTSLELSEHGAWSAGLRGGARILLGRTELASRVWRLQRYVGPLPATEKAALQRVDLRYDNGLAVRYASPPRALPARVAR